MRTKLTEVIDRDYITALKRKMEGVYAVQGGQDRAEKEKREREQKEAFVVSQTLWLVVSPAGGRSRTKKQRPDARYT